MLPCLQSDAAILLIAVYSKQSKSGCCRRGTLPALAGARAVLRDTCASQDRARSVSEMPFRRDVETFHAVDVKNNY